MHISHRYRFVFLATSHAASTSVGNLLTPFSDIVSVHLHQVTHEMPFFHHMNAVTAQHIFKSYGWDWSQYRHFCIVRNPFDRMVSLYHFGKRFSWLKGGGLMINGRRYAGHFLRSQKSFRDFVLQLNSSVRPNISMRGFICDAEGNALVEDILRYEELGTILPGYLRSLGVPSEGLSLPHFNASYGRDRDYREYYDDETRRHVETLFSYELSRFGYQF